MARLLLQGPTVTGTKTRQSSAGFTLVELSMVVVIIGILAVLAMVGYSRYLRHAKIAEAQEGIGAIKIAQEDYRAERGQYVDLGPGYCPAAGGQSDKKVGWDPGCSGGNFAFSVLPVHMAGAVQFQYSTQAGTGAYAAPTNAAFVAGNPGVTGPWFVVAARCDLDGQGAPNTELVSMSFTNQVFSRNEGK